MDAVIPFYSWLAKEHVFADTGLALWRLNPRSVIDHKRVPSTTEVLNV
jgi:hypothetical protein